MNRYLIEIPILAYEDYQYMYKRRSEVELNQTLQKVLIKLLN